MIKVAWFAPDFVSKKSSGTARLAQKLVANSKSNIQNFLILFNEQQIEMLAENELLSNIPYILMPKVSGKRFVRSRQFYKYCLINLGNKNFDYLIFHVPRVYPLYWLFPSKKFITIFHAGGEIIASTEKFIFSRFVYNLILKKQWKKLDKIVAVSKQGAIEIANNYGIPLKNISIIRMGVDHLWNHVATEKFKNINVLIIGRWNKFKNLPFVLENLNSNLKLQELINHEIYLLSDKSELQMEELKLSYPNLLIKTLNNLSEFNLAQYYKASHTVIFPSLNEGFGFPAFEAFSEGCNLLVHTDTPAAFLLRDYIGVFITDMKDKNDFVNMMELSLNSARNNPEQRKLEIEKLGLIWENTFQDFYQLFS